jgi:protein TonB
LTIDSSKDKIVVEQKHVDSSSKSIKHLPKLVEPTEQGLVGQIMFRDPIEDTSNEPYMFVEVMPEFVGGIDSLTSYLKQKINYPKWEKENKIEGTEIVTFLVDKDGNIKDAKVIRSVKGSKNFDEEVLRVINNMPSWKPGEHNNEQVDVKYTLPIKFEF